MLVECLILREGATTVSFKEHNYEFMPIPGSEEGEMTTSVANIANQDALDYFIGNDKKVPPIKGRPNFRPYRPAQAQKDAEDRRKKRAIEDGKFKGYSIVVVKIAGADKGYAVKHVKDDNSIEYCGSNGIWSNDIMKVWAFPNINEADIFLRAFMSNIRVEINNAPQLPYRCNDCGETFENPIKLAAHWEGSHTPKTDVNIKNPPGDITKYSSEETKQEGQGAVIPGTKTYKVPKE